jgi:hypothetical protein
MMMIEDGTDAGVRVGIGPRFPLTKTCFPTRSTSKQSREFNAGALSASPLRKEKRA